MKSRRRKNPWREKFMEWRREVMEKKYKPEELFKKGYPSSLSSLFLTDPILKLDMEGRVAKSLSKKKVLEIGPGYDPLAREIRDRTYLDASKFFLQELEGAKKVQGKIERLPFKDRKFDAVLMSDVLTHVRTRSVPRALRELARVSDEIWIVDHNVLDEKGRFQKHLDYMGVKVPSIRHEIRVDQIRDVLSKEGFKVRVEKIPLEKEGEKIDFFIVKAKRSKKK